MSPYYPTMADLPSLLNQYEYFPLATLQSPGTIMPVPLYIFPSQLNYILLKQYSVLQGKQHARLRTSTNHFSSVHSFGIIAYYYHFMNTRIVKNSRPIYPITSILKRADTFLDPVITKLDPGVLKLRGHKRVQSADTKVHKCYSPHGKWTEDHDRGELIVRCPEDAQYYMAPIFFFASRFLNSPLIDTERKTFPEKRPSPYARHRIYNEQGNRMSIPSPLSFSWSIDQRNLIN